MADGTPFLFPGDSWTGHCNVAVTGQTFVNVVANQQADGPYTIGYGAAGSKPAGVAMRDGAVGDRITVMQDGIQPVVAGAALVAGQEVMADAAGKAIPWVAAAEANVRAGKCMADTANGAVAPIRLSLS